MTPDQGQTLSHHLHCTVAIKVLPADVSRDDNNLVSLHGDPEFEGLVAEVQRRLVPPSDS